MQKTRQQRRVGSGAKPRYRCMLFVAFTLLAGLVPIMEVNAVKSGLNGKIAFTTNRDDDDEIATMNTDGSGLLQLTTNTSVDRNPSWSPDETASARIAFESQRAGNSEIYTMTASGASQTNITNNSNSDVEPAWSPDGTQIAFTSNRDGDNEVYVMNFDGSGVTQLTINTATDLQPAWSPDGTQIAFTSTQDQAAGDIYTMTSSGASQTRITTDAATDRDPSWSPGGTQILFTSTRGGSNDIYVMTSSGGSQTSLTSASSTERYPVWSPDGLKMALAGDTAGNLEIYGANSDATSAANLTGNSATDNYPDIQTEAAPNTTVASGPATLTNSTSATFSFSSTELSSTFSCQLDSGTAATCSASTTYSSLGEGAHTLSVVAVDSAGFTDSTAATYSWTIDTTEPPTTITSGPSQNSSSAAARFEFTSESGATFQCRLDSGEWSSCVSGSSISVADGHHAYDVRGLDSAGNADSTPASYSWSADTQSPDVTITSGPAAHTRSVSASFGFSASESNVAFECSLDGASFAPCTSVEKVSALLPGAHSFAVRATDAAGNIDPSPATGTWTVDRVDPRVQLKLNKKKLKGNATITISRSSLRHLSGTATDSDGIRKVKIALRIARSASAAAKSKCGFFSLRTGRRIKHPCRKAYAKVTGTTNWKLRVGRKVVNRLRRDEQYVLIVRATDLAGNVEHQRVRFRLK